jgi:hypothetical protein
MSSAKAAAYSSFIKANDLTTKSFPTLNSFGVITETKAGAVSFKSTISGDDKKPLAAVVEPKYEWKEQNLSFEGKASSANVFNAKGTLQNFMSTDGLNLYLQGDRSITWEKQEEEVVRKTTNTGTAGLQFNNDIAHFVAEVKVPVRSAGKVAVTSSLHAKPVDNVDVGVKVDWETGSPIKVEGKLQGGNGQIEGGVSVAYPSKTWGVNFWHSHCSAFQWALTLVVPPADAKKDPEPVVHVAGNYKFDDSTTLKARVSTKVDRTTDKDHAFRGALSLQQKVNANTTVTVGADVNLNHSLGLGSGTNTSNVGDASSCGFQISFK